MGLKLETTLKLQDQLTPSEHENPTRLFQRIGLSFHLWNAGDALQLLQECFLSVEQLVLKEMVVRLEELFKSQLDHNPN